MLFTDHYKALLLLWILLVSIMLSCLFIAVLPLWLGANGSSFGLCGGYDLGTCLLMRWWGPGALAVARGLPVGFLLLRFSDLFAVESLSLLCLLFISWFIFLWCLIVTLSLSHRYPGSCVVLDCVDSWSLPSFFDKNSSFYSFFHMHFVISDCFLCLWCGYKGHIIWKMVSNALHLYIQTYNVVWQ